MITQRFGPLVRAARRVDVFSVVERLLILASLALVAITIGGQLGDKLGLAGGLGTVVAWSIAIVFDALWIGSLRMSEIAIRQRSTVGMVVMLGLSAAAVAGSTLVLARMGHVEVFCFVPVAAALFMGLRLFADNVLADVETSETIAEQSAADRNARALAAADARHLRSGAVTDVVTETAEHLAEADRQIARADILTKAQRKIDEARAKAEARLVASDKAHGQAAAAFTQRTLSVLTPGGTGTAIEAGTGTGTARGIEAGTAAGTQLVNRPVPAAVPQAKAEIEAGTGEPVPPVEPVETEPVPIDGGVTLDEVAAAAGVETPEPGTVGLSYEQIVIVLRWLRYSTEPPRSYRQAVDAFRAAKFRGGQDKIRRAWNELDEIEAGTEPDPEISEA